MTNTSKVSDIAAAMNLMLKMRDGEGLRVFGLDPHWAAVLEELADLGWVEIERPAAKVYAYLTEVGKDALGAALADGMAVLEYRTTWTKL